VRPIHVAELDKPRPVLVLTRELVRPHMQHVTVAPITSRARGLSTELPVGAENGLESASVVNLDNIITIDRAALGRQIGVLLDDQEEALSYGVRSAFDLD
jgi:mRNA interferase MazF